MCKQIKTRMDIERNIYKSLRGNKYDTNADKTEP